MQFSSGSISSFCLRRKKSDYRILLIWEFSEQVQEKDKDAQDLNVLVREQCEYIIMRSRLIHLGNYRCVGSQQF